MLVATDGSEDSLDAARYAASLARPLRARVTLLHVIPRETIPLAITGLRPEDMVEIERAMWDGGQAILDSARVPFDQLAVRVEGLLRRGDAAEEIVRVAREEEIDLIVVASQGSGGAERAILGSTSDAVVRGAPCPVLVARRGTAR